MPGADDDDAERPVGRDVGLAPAGRAEVLAAEGELLLEQREVVVDARPTDDVLDDPQELVGSGRRRRAAAAVAEAHEDVEREPRASRC